MAIGGKIIRGAAWSAVDNWSQRIISFAIFIVFARLLSPEEIGHVTLAMSIFMVITIPISRGIPEALIQRKDIEPLHADSSFWLLTMASVAMFGFFFAFADVFARAFDDRVLGSIFRWASPFIILRAIIAVPEAILRRQLNFRLLTMRTIIATFAGGLLGVIMAWNGYGVWSVVAMHLGGSSVEVLVLFLGNMWFPRLAFSLSHCRQLFGFAMPILGMSLLEALNDAIPRILLGLFLGPAAVGIYSIARKPLEIMQVLFVRPISAIIMPAVSRIQLDKLKIERFFDFSVRISSMIGFPAFVGFASIASLAIPVIFGERWTGAILVSQMLAMTGLTYVVRFPCEGTVVAVGHSGLVFRLRLIYTAIATIAAAITIQLGIEFMVLALVVADLVMLPFLLYFTTKMTLIDVMGPIMSLPRYGLASVAMFVTVAAWLDLAPAGMHQAYVMALGIGIGASVYCLLAFVLFPRELLHAKTTILKYRT